MAAQTSKNPDQAGVIKETTRQLLEKVGVQAEISVNWDKDNRACEVQIDTEDAGIVIGRRGEAIGALQTILFQIIRTRSLDETPRILVNVGNWRQKREEVLANIATTAAARALSTGEPQPIYDLSPSERRFVHVFLSSEQAVTTESEGEGRDRHLVVKPV